MKIGIDCHNLEGIRTGSARYLMNLLKYWADEKSLVFALYFKSQIPDDIPKSLNFQIRLLNGESNALFEHFLLPKAIKKDKIDIFFSPSYILPFKIPKRVKTAVAVHDISYEAHPEWFSWQNRILLKWISKKSVKKADIIFVPSVFTKKEILKYYKVDVNKIHVIPLAADEKFTLHHSGEDAGFKNVRQKYKIKNKFIFYVGAIFNRRFVPETIEAFKKIANKLPDHQFLIGGPNYTYPYIEIDDLIKKTNQEIGREAVLHIDYIEDDDLVLLYNSADLFIWLSSYEGFGLPPLEAMACGTPVITTKKASSPEAVGDSVLFIENPEDIDEISEKIYRGLTDENLRENLIKKGLKQAEKFNWQKTSEETLKIIKDYAK